MQANTPIKLSQLTGSIATTVEDAFKDMRFWVIADMTNHSFRQEKGYHNFELVEKDAGSANVIAKIAGKSWGNGARQIAAFEEATGQRFTNNIQVLVLVAIEYHPVYGLSANVLDIDPNFTIGLLEQQKKATLERLVAQNDFITKYGEGYQTGNNRLVLKPVLQRIALLSSSISAGAEDFMHTLQNNAFGYGFQVDEYFVSVQGERNAGQFLDKLVSIFTSGIEYDAVVITRGGGSQTDFLIFDNYRIARAVAKFPIPIITGIGHQKNQSITDLMVHTQTKTPTKAAEFIIAHNRNFEERVNELRKNIIIRSQQLLSGNLMRVASLRHTVINSTQKIVAHRVLEARSLRYALVTASRAIVHAKAAGIVNTIAQLSVKPKLILSAETSGLSGIGKDIRQLSADYLRRRKDTVRQNRFVSGATLNVVNHNLARKKERLFKMNRTLAGNSKSIIFRHNKQLIQVSGVIIARPSIALNNYNNDLGNTKVALKAATQQALKTAHSDIGSHTMAIRLMAPENILKKGYAIILKDGQVISKAEKINTGDTVDIILSGSIITSTVNQKSEYDGTGTNL